MLTEQIQLCDECWQRINSLKRLKDDFTGRQVDELGDEKPTQVIDNYLKAGMPLLEALESCCGKTRPKDLMTVLWLYM